MREDPIGIQRGMNYLYVYARNNTLKYFDADGQLIGVVIGVTITAAVVIIVVKCLDDCAKENPCNDPADPDRGENMQKCLNRCIPLLEFLGWESLGGLLEKVGQGIGTWAGGGTD